MKSRLLLRLECSIAAARDPLQAACLAAERAALLGRMGCVEEAVAELASLRACSGTAHSPALGVWICLAEGVVEHERHPAAARDRIQRAYALATAARLRPLIALTAAWLAWTDDLRHDAAGLARHAAEALQEAPPGDHAARARASLVVAQGYHRGGRPERAQDWYRLAHEHATAEGDETLLGALLKSRAWIAGKQARMASVFSAELLPADAMALRHAQMSVESSEHFDAHAGHAVSRSLALVMRAQLLVAQARYEEALPTLEREAQAASADVDAERVAPAVLQADIAWCRLNAGGREEALASARAAEHGLGSAHGTPEDLATAHGRLRQVFQALGHEADAAVHAELADAQRAALREQQARLVQQLDAALRQVTDAPRMPVHPLKTTPC
jgi:tetratricopeptide (TPR) repeat protein